MPKSSKSAESPQKAHHSLPKLHAARAASLEEGALHHPSVLSVWPRHLRASLEGDKMLAAVYQGRKQALRTAAQILQQLFNTENCSIFLVPPGKPNVLELDANTSRKWRSEPGEKLRISLKAPVRESLTANLARRGVPRILDSRELRSPAYATTQKLRHLTGGEHYSMMVVPLHGRDRKLEGLLRWENKKGILGQATPDVGFTEEDLEVAKMLAEKLKLLLFMASAGEDMDVLEAAGNLMVDIQEKRRDGLLSAIIERAVRLLRADRGDFAWWTAENGDLVYAAHFGDTPNKDVAVNKPVPNRSFMRQVFKNHKSDFRIAYDLNNPKERRKHQYVAANPKTRSELAVPVVLDGNPVGVLNVESSEPNQFNERDADVLRIVARHAALAVQMVQSDGLVRDALQHTGEPETILMPILDGILEACGFDEGILYRASTEQPLLRVAASRNSIDFNASSFTHALDGKSLAAWAYNQKLSKNPEPVIVKEPLKDPRVDWKAYRRWRIAGPIMAYPLYSKGAPVGCLVLWCRNRPFPTQINKARLEDLSRLAATKIALAWAERSLYRSRERFERLAENSQLMVFTKRARLWKKDERRPKDRCPGKWKITFEYANPKFLHYIKRKDVEEIRDKTDWDFFSEHAPGYYKDDLKVLEGEMVTDKLEENIRPRDKSRRQVVVWKSLLKDRDEAGNEFIYGIQVVFWDCTEQHEVEEERKVLMEALQHRARDSLKEVGVFLALEQHRWSKKNPELRDAMHDARLRVKNMEVLFRLLWALRPSGKRKHPEQVPMRTFLRTLVKSISQSFSQRESDAQIELDVADIQNVNFPEDVAKYCGIIATELVANAFGYAFRKHESGVIKVSLHMKSNRIELSVLDNGRGFSGRNKKDAWNLGLTIIDRLARRQLGGEFKMAPVFRNKNREGLLCSVAFPFRQKQRRRPIRPLRKPGDILLVEDNQIEAIEYESLFDSENLSMCPTVGTKEEAIEAAEKWQPKVIVMDLWLGREESKRLAGLEAAEAIRERSDVPIIFLTNTPLKKTSENLRDRIHKLKADLVPKGMVPKDDDSLLFKVSLALQQKRGRKVFVSYSHEDAGHQKELMRHLRRLRTLGADIEDWSDKYIKPGEDWHKRIQESLDQSVAAVVLVSADFMDSEYIRKWELKKLLEMAQNNDLYLAYIQVQPCSLDVSENERLDSRQFFGGTHDKPMGKRSKSDRESIWWRVTEEIKRKLLRRNRSSTSS